MLISFAWAFLNCLEGRTGSANASVPLNYPLNAPPFFILISYPRVLQLLSALSASKVFLPTSFTPNKYCYICPFQKSLVPAVLMPAVLCMLLWELQLLLFPSFLKPVVNPSAKGRIAVKSWDWRDGLLSKVLLQFDGLSLLQHKHKHSESCGMKTRYFSVIQWDRDTHQCPCQLLLLLVLIWALLYTSRSVSALLSQPQNCVCKQCRASVNHCSLSFVGISAKGMSKSCFLKRVEKEELWSC